MNYIGEIVRKDMFDLTGVDILKEYELIKLKKSKLSAGKRKYICYLMNVQFNEVKEL